MMKREKWRIMRKKLNANVICIAMCITSLVVGLYNLSDNKYNTKNKPMTVEEELESNKRIEEASKIKENKVVVEKGDEESQFVVKQKNSISSQMVNTISSNSSELLQFPQLSDEDIYYLKKIATCEAGYVEVETMSLIMLVVLNRVKSPKFPNTVYEVIMQPNQFSVCYAGGPWYWMEPGDKADEAFDMIWDTLYEYSGGATFFESLPSDEIARNSWFGTNLDYLYKSGNVRFYKLKGE